LSLPRHGHQLELSILGHRVFVLLSEKPSRHEDVDARREEGRILGVLEFEERDSPRILLAAKDELGLFLSLRFVTPHGHRDRQQDGHDGQRDEQGGHRVSPFAAPLGLTA
jgi:hypothetical protein